MRSRRYTEKQFITAVRKSRSYAEVCRRLNIVPNGGNYTTVKRGISNLGLNCSHMTGQSWARGKKWLQTRRKPLDQILIKDCFFSSDRLRKRLIEEGIKEKKCEICGKSMWNGSPIPLELDHINGVKSDNRLSNLRILCPNCHAQTPTHRGKNIGRDAGIGRQRPLKMGGASPVVGSNPPPGNTCSDCGCSITSIAWRCRPCAGKLRPTKINWPPALTLKKWVSQSSYLAVGKKLDVSDNAVRKRIKRHGT